MYTTNAQERRAHAKKRMSKELLKAEAEHARFLKRMGVGDLQRTIKLPAREPAYARPTPDIPSLDSRSGTAAKPAPKVYRGERKLLGVATMHKSNMVPVFADKPEEAAEIAKMRR
jgi:hypothetical protein